jgi:LAO/AO transport system kinase
MVAFNKADGDDVVRAEAARKQLQGAMDLFSAQAGRWKPPVVTCSARTGAGIPEIWNTVLEHRSRMLASGELQRKRRRQAREAMHQTIRRALSDAFFGRPDVRARLATLENEVMEGRITASAAARMLIQTSQWDGTGPSRSDA